MGNLGEALIADEMIFDILFCEGDFKGCFDDLNQEFMLEKIKGFPGLGAVKGWLEAGLG